MLRLRPYKDCDVKTIVTWIKNERNIIGHMIMRFIDEDKSIIRFGFIIIDDKLRDRNYGKQVVRLAIQYAFEFLKIIMLLIIVIKVSVLKKLIVKKNTINTMMKHGNV
ncbi:MAG: GNAT family N-acetyltransferase [Erysipelotrichaceae bacterium]|nr:GNAT family N-acetyltransferase [Erysipelotrichaceae bacterium]